MWLLLKELCGNPAFQVLMYIVIFTILGYLFRQKTDKGVHEKDMKAVIEHLKAQNIDLARLEKRLWDLATGNDQMPLDPEVEKKANGEK